MTTKYILGFICLMLPAIELAFFENLPRTWTPRAWFTFARMAITQASAYALLWSAL